MAAGTSYVFFFQAEDGIRDGTVTGVQTCALPISVAVEDATALPVDDAHRVGGVVEDRAEALALLRQGAPLHDARHQERDRGDADEGEGEVRGPHPREHRLAAQPEQAEAGEGDEEHRHRQDEAVPEPYL